MRTVKLFLILLFLLLTSITVTAEEYASMEYDSITLLNSTNLALRMSDFLGYLYDSRGCVHLTPSDALLLTSTLSPGIPLKIMNYDFEKKKTDLPDVPELASLVMDENDLENQRLLFGSRQTEVVVYPSLKIILIKVSGKPYARVRSLAGPWSNLKMPLEVNIGEPIVWDPFPATPTDPGNYSILNATDHYISQTYNDTTVIPFGVWIMKRNGFWYYQENNEWLLLHDYIIQDIEAPEGKRKYSYFDVNYNSYGSIEAARWGSHDFGRHVLQWTRDGRNLRPEMAYSCGELMLDQISLVKSLAYLLTVDGPDDLDALAPGSSRLSFYREVYRFLKTGVVPPSNAEKPRAYAYFRLFNKWPLSESDCAMMDERLVKALKEYRERILPRNRQDREETIGLYYYLKVNSEMIKKYALWYSKLKDDWPFWANMRSIIRKDLSAMGVAPKDRGLLVEKWLTDRLEFRSVAN